MRNLCLIVCLLAIGFLSFGQENKVEWISGTRDMLPQWIFSVSNEGAIISMSDAGLPLEMARKQAVQRGLLINALAKGARIRQLHDYFTFTDVGTNNYELVRDKLILYTVLECSGKECSYQVRNEYVSRFGEVFLELSFGQLDKEFCCEKVFNSRMEIMLDSKSETKKEELVCKLEMMNVIAEDKIYADYIMKATRSGMFVLSYWNGELLFLPGKECWYDDVGRGDEDNMVQHSKLKYSFWSAYVMTLAKTIISSSFSEVTTRNLNEQYNKDVKELLREKVNTEVTCRLKRMWINQDNLYVEWSIK